MKNFEEKGHWWLPEYPEDKVIGTLKFSPETGIELDLMGDFEDRTPWEIDENGNKHKTYYANTKTYNFIIGENFVGKKFTIYKPYQLSSSGSLFDTTLRATIYTGFYLFSEYHFTKEEELYFDTFRLKYHYLPEWFGISGYKLSTKYLPMFEFDEYNLKYKNPEEVIYKINNLNIKSEIKSFDLSIYHYLYYKIEGINPFLEQNTMIEIKIQSELFFQDFRNEIEFPLETFFMFLIRKNQLLLEIWVKNKNFENSIQVFYKNPNPYDYKDTYSDYFIKYSDIKDNFDKYLSNWFIKISKLKPVFDLYFGSVYNNKMYLQNKFLSLSQALEVYHRRLLRKPELSKEELLKRSEIILNLIPLEYKEWLEPRLKHNESSLKNKLEELKEIVKPFIETFISDFDSLPKEVADRRNYLTHYDEKAEKKYSKEEDFYKIISKLSYNMIMILDVLFLIEIELDNKEIEKILKENLFKYYSQYIS